MHRLVFHRGIASGLISSLAVVIAPALAVMTPISGSAAAPCAASTFAMSQIGGAIVNGRLYTWGRNFEGELGQGPFPTQQGTPTPVSSTTGFSGATGFWPGFQDTFATDATGQLWAWGGFNSFNERGNATGNNLPQPVVGPTHVISVGPGDAHTIALTANGTMWGWGDPSSLGLPGRFPVNPTQLSGPANIVKVVAGSDYSFALASDGTLYGTGSNQFGTLGLGQGVTSAPTFTAIQALSGIVDMAASSDGPSSIDFSVAVDGSGHVFGFGSNFYGQMGNGGTSTSPQFTPTRVQGIDSVVQVSAGLGFVLALKQDGTVWGWGYNGSGTLGNNSQANSPIPVQAQFPAGVQIVRIAAGFSDSMALDSQGHLWAWGYNGDGEVGNGFILAPPVLKPSQLNLGQVVAGCAAPAPPQYMPSRNGYSFPNNGSEDQPSYDQMASFYPKSRSEIYIGRTSHGTVTGSIFYHTIFLYFYSDGVCYGMAASNQFLFNEFPDKSAFADFASFRTPFSTNWGPSPSPGDTNIEQMINRYHSRQLAAAGAITAGQIWSHVEDSGGNTFALDTIASVTDTGKTEWVGLGPARRLLSQGIAGKAKFAQLFGISHAVLAYKVDKSQNLIHVYDPNAPGDDNATLQIVPDASRPGGGVKLVHGDGTVTYGGGGASGDPIDWTLMPLAEAAFSNQGIVQGQDNEHWVLDAAGLAFINRARQPAINGLPLFSMQSTSPRDVIGEMLQPGSGYSSTLTADGPGSETVQITGSHAAQVTQTDSTAAGSTHDVSISADSSAVVLSNASAAEQYSIVLGGDFLASAYSRQMTVSGMTLTSGAAIKVATDPADSTLTLSESNGAGGNVALLLEQISETGGSASVTATVPGSGGQGVVYVADWTGLQSSLIFEVITAADGSVTGLLLQDNPAQRQALLSSLLDSLQPGIAQIGDEGIRGSLESKLDNASRQAPRNPVAAANMLQAMRNEVAAQKGKAIAPDLAASLDATLGETIGLLRSTVG